ncbi:DUF1289 domain-containing protein [Cognatishimia activa]|uniref:Putative Fe-S protein n=1 Tax=Cognatishimia activa TaxID=1715691 RepID=A0A0P1ITM3_9RHOB|nr:DUF1289 domain-containing protein [Cognatishimia activa]MEE2945620.1 DUF1289 domain-containing protein [Pseudomonadota bacterium]CUI79399.1 putative Fe-S protein [Cognatishimia activa]CUK26844.1 putative Fe-S protein [Cognatishimia activa]
MAKKDKSEVWSRAEISSPCVSLCGIHPTAEICTGCYRTMDEILEWGRYTEDHRLKLMSELPSRASRLKQRRGGRNRALKRQTTRGE